MRPQHSLLALLLLAVPSLALAQEDARIVFLGKRLKEGKDPRARSQAALALAATEDPDAVAPLCAGLQDPSELVRGTAAQALARLQEISALECLEARSGERDATALAALKKAITTLRALKSRPPRLYIAFGGVKDKTGALPAEVVKLAEARMRRKLVQEGALLAPAKESKAGAQGVLKKHRIKGYRLTAEIREGSNGGLRIAVVCATYPELLLLGDVDVQAAGAEPAELIRALAPRAVEEAAETFWSS